MHRIAGIVSVIILATACAPSSAEVLETGGTITQLDVAERMLTLKRKKGGKEKLLELEVADKAKVLIGDMASSLDAFKVGDEVSVKYDTVLETITELEKGKAEAANIPKLLRTKFAASKASFDPASGVLTLAYDFSKPSQLKDFEFANGVAQAGNGGLRIAAAEQITHIAEFSRGSVTGRFVYGNREGQQVMVGVTGKASVQFHQFNEFWIQLFSEGQEVARKDAGRAVPLTLQWDVSGQKTRLLLNGKAELGAARGDLGDIGRFHLNGGNGGLVVSGLIISGVPKEGWLADFLAR